MAKVAVQHACTECGYAAARWFGRCPGCGAFGTLVEETPAAAGGAAREPRPILRLVDVDAEEAERIPTGVPELDRVLGGGIVPASLVLVGGEPGVGKSTLLLSALAAISSGGRRALLVTGEESTAQVKLRAARLGGAGAVEILAETELEAVCAALERERPAVCVIDSVQTLYSAELGSAPGSVAQVREAAARLLRVATGVDPRRLGRIVAALSRHARVALGTADVFVNVAGGVRIDEPGADLAVALAIASAARGSPVREGIAAFGEIGLTGRLRPAAQSERRLEECAKLGLSGAVAPAGTPARGKLHVEQVETLKQAIRAGLD